MSRFSDEKMCVDIMKKMEEGGDSLEELRQMENKLLLLTEWVTLSLNAPA